MEDKIKLFEGYRISSVKYSDEQLIHCDLHGGNIVLNNEYDDIQSTRPFICDLGLSKSVKSNSTPTIQGVLPYIAPEVLDSHKFAQISDIYSFGIIMHQIANGEPPFRVRQFDRGLVCDILNGLR